MSGFGVSQFLQAARQQGEVLRAELSRMKQEAARHAQNRQAVTASLDAARADLARSLLPGLTAERVAKAIQLTGFAPWRHQDPIRALEGEREALTRRLAAIEAEETFKNGELLFHPRTGSVTRELTEVTAHLATQQQVLATAESHPRFSHLFHVGYGTPQYAVPFWRVSFYDDWKAGDEILERFPGKSFDQVRAAWGEARQAATTLQEEVLRLDAILRQGRARWEEHKAAKAKLQVLPGEHLVAAQKRLLDHVVTSHAPTMLAALARDPHLPNLYLRTTALAAKVHYLDGVYAEMVVKPQAAMQEQLGKLNRDEIKYRRPKNAHAMFAPDAFQKRFADRRSAYDKRWKRYNNTYVALWSFDSWDRVPADREFLWWDVMTDGRVDGDYLPDVGDWHRRHGRPTYLRDRHDHDQHEVQAAAAAAAADRDDDALLRGHDPS